MVYWAFWYEGKVYIRFQIFLILINTFRKFTIESEMVRLNISNIVYSKKVKMNYIRKPVLF